MNNKTNERPFGILDKVGYMFGDFGNDFTFIFASSYLMVFYTKVLGVSGAVVGTLFLLARCVDAFTDVGMGRLVDTLLPARDGRFRPWLRRMAIPVAAASTLMYLYFVRDLPYPLRIVYISVTYLLWGSVCYTGINIPYGSMASVISSDAGHRASLSTFRTVGSTLAALVIGMGTPLLVYTSDGAGNQLPVPGRFTIIAVVYGLCAIFCYALCYRFCRERTATDRTQQGNEKQPFFSLVRELLKNRSLLSIIGAALLLLLASLLTSSMNSYLFIDYFRNTRALSLITFLSIGGTLVIAPFAVKISGRFGKKEGGSICMLGAGILYVAMYLLKIRSIPVFMALTALAYLGLGFFNTVIWALITDVIDDQEVKNGHRDDGTVYAIYSFARKLGQALAGGVSGFTLTAIGYVTGTTAVVQTQSTIQGIYTISTLIPGICYLLIFLVIVFAYPLSKSKVEANITELKRRRSKT